MKAKVKFLIGATITCALIQYSCSRSANAQTTIDSGSVPISNSSSAKVIARLDLFFFLLNRGTTAQNSSPAIDTIFGYNFGGPKIGFQASSRKLYLDDEYLKYSVFVETGFKFSNETGLNFKIDLNQFTVSKIGYRLDLELWTYFLFYSKQDNWLGTNTNRVEIGVYKFWKTFWNLDWFNALSNVTNAAPAAGNYFLVRSGLGYSFNPQAIVSLNASFVSQTSIDYNIDGLAPLYLQFTGSF